MGARDGYWTAPAGTTRHRWLPAGATTFDATVHFVQSGSGTGVHIGGGRVLTCAHVVDSRDDEQDGSDESSLPARVGRRKLVMFPNGRTFVAACVAVNESADGCKDVAVVSLERSLR